MNTSDIEKRIDNNKFALVYGKKEGANYIEIWTLPLGIDDMPIISICHVFGVVISPFEQSDFTEAQDIFIAKLVSDTQINDEDNLLASEQKKYSITPRDICTLASTFGFDEDELILQIYPDLA